MLVHVGGAGLIGTVCATCVTQHADTAPMAFTVTFLYFLKFVLLLFWSLYPVLCSFSWGCRIMAGSCSRPFELAVRVLLHSLPQQPAVA